MQQSQFLDPEQSALDRKIIAVLKRDPRASISAIAAEIETQRPVVARHLRDLTESQAIRISAALNPDYLGLNVLAHLSINVQGPATEVTDWLKTWPDAVFVSLVTGTVDIIAELRVKNHAALHDCLTRIRAHPTVHSVNTNIYSRMFRTSSFGHEHDPIQVDDIDEELIALLQHDGRMGFQAMASEVNLSPSAVRSRVQRLVDANILRFGAVEARGWSGRQLALGVGIRLSSDSEDLLELFSTSPSVDFAMDTIGHYDAVATLVADSPLMLLALVEELRAREDTVRVDSWLHLHTVKEDFTRLI